MKISGFKHVHLNLIKCTHIPNEIKYATSIYQQQKEKGCVIKIITRSFSMGNTCTFMSH